MTQWISHICWQPGACCQHLFQLEVCLDQVGLWKPYSTLLVYLLSAAYSALIVSIAKFSIMIGSLRAYLSWNWHTFTWVSNYRRPIWTFCNRTPVIGYPCDFHVNYVRFNGFLSNVLCSFQNLGKALQTFSVKRSSQKTLFNSKSVIDTIN